MTGNGQKNTALEPAPSLLDLELAPIDPERTQLQPAKDPQAPATVTTDGDLNLADHGHMRESVHAKGHLRLGRHVHMEGDVTTGADAEVGDHTRIDGTLRVKGRLHWGRGAEANRVELDGPLITSDGLERVTSLEARHGIHAGVPDRHRDREAREP